MRVLTWGLLVLAAALAVSAAGEEAVDEEFGAVAEEPEVEAVAVESEDAAVADPDELDDYDEDEFDTAVPPAAPAQGQQEQAPAADGNGGEQKPPQRRSNMPETWEWEILALTAVVAYIGVFFFGSASNQSIANKWYEQFAAPGRILSSSFAKTRLIADEGSPFSKETANQFRFYASGRRNTLGLIAGLHLLPRHDLLSWVMALLSGQEDTVSLEVFIDPRCMGPYVLAVTPRRSRRRVQKESTDLALFSTLVEPRRLPRGFQGLSVLTDADEARKGFLRGPAAALLARHAPPLPSTRYRGDSSPDADATSDGQGQQGPSSSGDAAGGGGAGDEDEAESSGSVERSADPLFRLLHITDSVPYYDRGVTPLSTHAVRMQLKLPASEAGQAELLELTKLLIDLADRAASFKLPLEVSKRNERERTKVREARRKLELEERGETPQREQAEAMAEKEAELRRLQLTDRKEYLKQTKKLQKKMMRKRSRVVKQ